MSVYDEGCVQVGADDVKTLRARAARLRAQGHAGPAGALDDKADALQRGPLPKATVKKPTLRKRSTGGGGGALAVAAGIVGIGLFLGSKG